MFEQSEQFIKISSKILGQKYDARKLTGGINNPTYLINNKEARFVLKKIKTAPTPTFDRYLAEKQFLHLTNTIGVLNTPKLIDFYDSERILILEYIEPDNNLELKNVNVQQINACIKFLHEVNSKKELSINLVEQRAAESYLDLNGHLDNINSRILNFNTHHLSDDNKNNANELLILLNNKWEILKDETLNFIEMNPNKNNIDKSFLIISPSDFGFHNVVISKGINYFIDFEFSGWDDPAKLYCDFILQPKIPIPKYFHTLVKHKFLNKIYLAEYKDRIDILYNLLKFKWYLIKYSFLNKDKFILNQFNNSNLFKINLKNYLDEIY